jgi:hypothetical protein
LLALEQVGQQPLDHRPSGRAHDVTDEDDLHGS